MWNSNVGVFYNYIDSTYINDFPEMKKPIKEMAQISIVGKLARVMSLLLKWLQSLYRCFTVIGLFFRTVYPVIHFMPSDMFRQNLESQGLGCPTMELK